MTWEQWLALADAAERAGLDALFRSDHLAIGRGGEARVARRVDDARRPRRPHRAATARHAGLARHVSPRRRARQERRHGRPRLGRPCRARDRRRLVRGRAPRPTASRSGRSANAWPSSSVSSRRSTSTGAPEASARSRCSSRRRSSSARSAKPRTVAAAVRWADEYSTTFAVPEEADRRRNVVARGLRARRPRGAPLLRHDAGHRRLRRGRPSRPRSPLRRLHGPGAGRAAVVGFVRRPTGCASTRRRASSASCSSMLDDLTSRWSGCSASWRAPSAKRYAGRVGDELRHLSRRLADADAGSLQRRLLRLGGPGRAGDDRAEHGPSSSRAAP